MTSNKLSVLSAIATASANAVTEYQNESAKRDAIIKEHEQEEQTLLLISKKNEADRLLSDFFNQNFRVAAVPDDFDSLKGRIPALDREGLTDKSSALLDNYIDSALSRRYITTKEYQTRHIADGALAGVQTTHDEIYNNLQQGETNFTDAKERSAETLATLTDLYSPNDLAALEKDFNDQLLMSYAKSMSYETLLDHVKSGFFNDQVSHKTMDAINSLLVKKHRLTHASTLSKNFSLEKAITSIAKGEIASEEALQQAYGTHSQELLLPFRAAKEYLSLTNPELRMIQRDLEEELQLQYKATGAIDSNSVYKQKIIADLLLYRADSIRKDPISFGQNAELIHRNDPNYLAIANIRDMEHFVAQRNFDMRKFDEFFGIKSNKILNKNEREVIVSRFKNSDSAEERLKIVSLFGDKDVVDLFFPGSTAAAITYNSTSHPLIARFITTDGNFNRKGDASIDYKAYEVTPIMNSIAFATPSNRESYEHLFTQIAIENNRFSSKKIAESLKGLGIRLDLLTYQGNSKRQKNLAPLKVLNFGRKLDNITPEFLYEQARNITGDKKTQLYNGAGQVMQGKILSDKDYIIQLYSDDGVHMYPRIIGLRDGTISDLYFDNNAQRRFFFEWR